MIPCEGILTKYLIIILFTFIIYPFIVIIIIVIVTVMLICRIITNN